MGAPMRPRSVTKRRASGSNVSMIRDFALASDLELLRACHTDEAAFAVFYRRHERVVAGYLMRRTGRPDLTADLTAEVFAAAYLAAPRFRAGPEPAGAWLLGIARNKLRRSLRRDRLESSARERLGIERIVVSDESLAAVAGAGGEDLLALVGDLPSEQRDAVTGRVLDELGYRELAERLGVTESNARQRVSRGLAAIRRRSQQPGGG
jgi:RNA polymerase sigma factor (sigma-70 family)